MLLLFEVISLVRPRRRLSPAPTAERRGRRAQMLSRLARFSAATGRLGLYSIEHDGTLAASGPPYTGCCESLVISKSRPWCNTPQAMRASLWASAIASLL